jgi:SAM-dependent methyltransferase
LLAIPYTDWELLYGFNAPETGFVWSNFAFGIRFRSGDANIALLAMYPHDEGVLHVHNSAGGSKDYPLARGDNLIFLHAPPNAPRFDFSVSPQRAMPEEVRELGVLLRVAHRAATRAELNAAGPVIDGVKGDWIPAQRLQAGKLLTRCLLESYVGPGVFMSYVNRRNPRAPVMELAMFPPSWAARRQPATVKMAINTDVIDVPVTPSMEADRAYALAHLPATALRGFVDLRPYALKKGELPPLDIRWVDEHGQDFLAGQDMHWRGEGHGAMPAEKNIFRVAGPASEDFFLFSGATWFVKLTKLYESLTGRQFGQCGPVLDWGIGCGRIARFFDLGAPKLYGVDIDAVNIAWCKKHLRWVETVQTSTNPPLPFADGMFELVYGHSVMTHLSEADQLAWLAELARVTRPGGYCLLTVLNELSWFIRYFPDGRSADQLEAFISAGIMDDGSLNVGVDADRPGAYRNMSHSSAYIFRVWAECFEVVRIVHGFADLQSLVVLRRRD